MNAIEARVFVEQVLSQPNVDAAAQVVQKNSRRLDDTFFAVLQQMIEEEISRSAGGSWGNSFEDRLAESLARISERRAPSQRQQALQMLLDYALQVRAQAGGSPGASAQPLQLTCPQCQQTYPVLCPGFGRHAASATVVQAARGASCTLCGAQIGFVNCSCGNVISLTGQPAAPSAPPKGNSFEYYVREIQKLGSANQAAEPPGDDEPAMDDISKMRRLIANDQRHNVAMMKTLPGMVSEAVVEELESIQQEYERLVRFGEPTKYPLYKIVDLQGKIAACQESLARAHESLRHDEKAREFYAAAAQAYDELGHAAKAAGCRENIAQIDLALEGNVDDEILRLQHALDAIPRPSLEHVRRMIKLAELQSANGDTFAADEMFQHAEAELEELGHSPGGPSGGSLAQALFESVRQIQSGVPSSGSRPIEEQMTVRNCFRSIYNGRAQIFRQSNPAEAARYLAMAKQLDSAEDNKAFSSEMLKMLPALFGENPPSPPRRPRT